MHPPLEADLKKAPRLQGYPLVLIDKEDEKREKMAGKY
jgi:hypothetical protein